MADVNANIGVNIDTTQALAQLKSLQRQISQFHTSIAKSSETAALAQRDLQRNFINAVNSIGSFSAELRNVKTTSESFTDSLEKNKFSMREYFRYAGASTKTFGKLFKSEFDTIGKVAEDRVKKLQTQYIKLGRDTTGAMKAIAIIPNELDMNNWSTKTQIAAQKQALFNQLVRQGSTNLLNFGKNTQWAGRQLMVGFTLPLATLGTTATKVFMSMEAAALKFRKVYGDLFTPREETQQALEDVTALGQMFTRYGIAVSDTVALAAEAAAAGFQGVDLQRQTTQATRLSVLGQIDNQKALETTISLQNAFKMSSDKLAESIDFLNAVENQTVVSLDDITTAIPKVAPVIQQLGGDVKDLTFFMAAMKEGGVNASEGANALKSGLAALINPTEKASEMLANMGINITKIIESNKGNLKATVIEFAQALDTLDPLTRARAIEQLFGKFQFARLSTLFDNVINQTGQASRVLDLAGTSIEDLAALSEQELGMTADSAMNKFRKSVEDMKLALVPVGETFLKAITPIVEFIGDILEKFNGLSDGVKKAIVVMTVAIGAIGPIALMTFGLLANGLANIVKGAMILRNGYLRLTGQTQILGEQTDYLTMEQINAAAASHSLDQSHAKLTQTFTAETGAINQLIQAYQSAARAGAQFAATNPGMMVPPRKYANGVRIVPGSGNKDTIPAMLTPGEAVIPKDKAKQYAPLIQGMIAGNIPGYRKGKNAPGSGASGRIGKSGVSVPISYRQNVSSSGGAVDFLQINPQDIVNITSIYTKQIAQTAKVSIAQIDKEINNWKMANVNAIREATELVNQGVSAETAFAPVVDKFNKDMIDLGGATSKFVQTAKQEMPELQKDFIQAQQKARELNLNVKNAADASRLLVELPSNIVAKGMATPGSYTRLGKARQASASMMGGISGIGQYGIPRFMVSNLAEPSSPAYLAASSQEHFSTTTQQSENLEVQRRLRQQARQNVDITVQETKRAAGTQSPSKKTIPIGEDIARGLQVGMQNQADEVAATAASVSQGATRAMRVDSATRAAQEEFIRQNKTMISIGGVPVDKIKAAQAKFNSMSAAEQAEVLSRNQGETQAMRPSGLLGPKGEQLMVPVGGSAPMQNVAQNVAINNQIKNAMEKEIVVRKTMQQRLSSMNGALMSGTFALTSLAGAGSFAGGAIGEISQAIFKYSGLLFGLMSVTQLLTQVTIAKLAADRIGLAQSVIANAHAAGAAKITGRSGLLGVFARLLLGIKTFLGPIGLATTAVGLIAIGIKSYKKAQEEARQQTYGLSEAMRVTADQAKTLGDFFGVVVGKSSFESRAELRNREIVGKETRSERDRLRQDESFQKEFKTQIRAFSTATNEEAKLAFQSLAIDLKSRGFATEQVQTIIDALREESAKTDVKFDVKSIDFSPESITIMNQTLRNNLEKLKKSYESGLKKITVVQQVGLIGGAGGIVEKLVPTKQLERQLANASSYIATTAQSASTMFEDGVINGEQYTAVMSSLVDETNLLDEAQRKLLLTRVFEKLNISAAPYLDTLYTAKQEMMLLALMSSGVLDKDSPILKALLSNDKTGKTQSRGINALRVEYEKLFGAFEKANKESDKGDGGVVGGTGEDVIQNAIDALKKQKKALENTTKSYNILRKNGFDAATALKYATDETIALGLASGKIKPDQIKTIVGLIEKIEPAVRAAAVREFFTKLGQETQLKKDLLSITPELVKSGASLENINNLLQNSEVVSLLADPLTTAAEKSAKIKQYLNAIAAQKEIDIKIKLQTPEGIDQEFADRKAMAMEYFDVLEREVQDKFEEPIKAAEKTAADAADTVKKIQDEIDGLQTNVATKQREIEETINRPIEALQQTINDLQRKMELEFDRPMGALQDESAILSEELTVMDKAAEGINKKYDLQAAALEKVSQANQEIINQQKQQLGLASALSTGDIAAAAQAAQEMRSSAAAAASGGTGAALQAARESEIAGLRSASGLTRDQIAQRQYEIDRQIFALQQQRKVVEAEILVKQDAIYKLEQARIPLLAEIQGIEDQIYGIQQGRLKDAQADLDAANAKLEAKKAELQAELDTIDAQRERWEDAQLALDVAKVKSKEFQDALKDNEKTVKAMVDKWNEMQNKNLTVTITEIRNVITNTIPGSNSGPSGGPTDYSIFKSKMYGGKVLRMASGGYVPGIGMTDKVPTLLTPGEFVVNRPVASKFGSFLQSLNDAKYPSMIGKNMSSPIYNVSAPSSSVAVPTQNVNMPVSDNSSTVYNYSVGITVGGTSASADNIAQTVLNEIKYIDSQRIRKQRA